MGPYSPQPKYLFQFTHPGRGATRGFCIFLLRIISFNSRTPGGVRRRRVVGPYSPQPFQFTHPGRGATNISTNGRGRSSSFNSRTPGGVRHEKEVEELTRSNVSIHAPREGCDFFRRLVFGLFTPFQFTHPGRGATYSCFKECHSR